MKLFLNCVFPGRIFSKRTSAVECDRPHPLENLIAAAAAEPRRLIKESVESLVRDVRNRFAREDLGLLA